MREEFSDHHSHRMLSLHFGTIRAYPAVGFGNPIVLYVYHSLTGAVR